MKALLLLSLTLALGAHAAPPPYKALPGWHRTDQCYPFSVAFEHACLKAGKPAVRLTFDWSYGWSTGRHCVVLFRDEGNLWLMDNQMSAPRRVKAGLTDLDFLKHTGFSHAKSMVDNVTLDTRAPNTPTL